MTERTMELISNFFTSVARAERETERNRQDLSAIKNYDPFQAFRMMDWEESGRLTPDGIQIFLGDLQKSPERFQELDYEEVLRVYDLN